ncbi:hypothetical protein ACVMB2_006377 [Sinorhizobium meliloti]
MWINGEARQGPRAGDEPPGRLRGGGKATNVSLNPNTAGRHAPVRLSPRQPFPNDNQETSITAQEVRSAAKGRVNKSNLASVLVALDRYGERFGMDRPHRLAQYFAQLMYESGDFR